jgi:hypothetical protein
VSLNFDIFGRSSGHLEPTEAPKDSETTDEPKERYRSEEIWTVAQLQFLTGLYLQSTLVNPDSLEPKKKPSPVQSPD